MKLGQGFEARNTGKNFEGKLLTIGNMGKKIYVLQSHRILVIFMRKRIFHIPDFVITRHIIRNEAPSSNNNWKFFIIYIYPRLRSTGIGRIAREKENFFTPFEIFFKKFFECIEYNVIW